MDTKQKNFVGRTLGNKAVQAILVIFVVMAGTLVLFLVVLSMTNPPGLVSNGFSQNKEVQITDLNLPTMEICTIVSDIRWGPKEPENFAKCYEPDCYSRSIIEAGRPDKEVLMACSRMCEDMDGNRYYKRLSRAEFEVAAAKHRAMFWDNKKD